LASVLCIASDPDIDELLGELIAFAGHRPICDVTGGAAGESVRRARPDIVMLDIALPAPVVVSCLEAAAEVGSPVVATSTIDSAGELEAHAARLGVVHFQLPGGPIALDAVIGVAIAARRCLGTPVPWDRRPAPVSPAFCAALASFARARTLLYRTSSGRGASSTLRMDASCARLAARRSRKALRAAVTDYVHELQLANLPPLEIVAEVRAVVSDSAAIVGAEATLPSLLDESDLWVREACDAA
jgi:CheY-like chemotaxis protein